MKKFKILLLLVMLVSMITTVTAWPEILGGFNRQYGTYGTRLDTCEMCHISRTPPTCDEQCHNGKPEKISNLNSYGIEIKKHINMKMDQAFKSIEKIDSGDGNTYIEKIQNLTLPKEKIGKNSKKLERPLINVSFFKKIFGYILTSP